MNVPEGLPRSSGINLGDEIERDEQATLVDPSPSSLKQPLSLLNDRWLPQLKAVHAGQTMSDDMESGLKRSGLEGVPYTVPGTHVAMLTRASCDSRSHLADF